tara:strand:- start:162 stop:1445 length:1284 start_codon:yes stop_codon:yes gene_type:complete
MQSNREQKADSASVGASVDVMGLNGLKYRIPQPISTGVSRSFKKEYSQKNEYKKNQVMVFELNTGTNYVNPDSAMLSFKYNQVQPVSADAELVTWCGSLGAAALMTEIRIISKNGIELDRISDAALLAKIIVDYSVSSTKLRELEMADGYGDAGVENTIPIGSTSFTNDLECLIPLKYLSGFFRPTIKGMLIPAGLASGLRIEISLTAEVVQAVQGNEVPSSYTVSDPVLILETTELNDPTQGALMRESASNGLEYTFPSYYSTKMSVDANGTIATQVNKAVSQGTRLFLALQEPFAADAAEVLLDSLKSQPASSYKSYQFRVGQNYFPNLLVDRKTEKMGYALSALSGWSDDSVPVSFDGYFTDGKAVIAASLETADRLNLSGLMLNNSSTGEVRLTVGTSAVRGVLFLEFIAVVKTSLNKSSLRI